MGYIRPVDVIKNISSNAFKIVQKYESIDAFWGIEHRKLTDNDITALKEGKYLYCNDGEYAQLISYESQELEYDCCKDEYIKVPKKALKYRTAGMVAYNVEWLKNHFDIERAVICGEQQSLEESE